MPETGRGHGYLESTGRLVGEKIYPLKSQKQNRKKGRKKENGNWLPSGNKREGAQALTPLRMDLTLSYSPLT